MDFKSSPFAMNEPAPEVTLYTTEPEKSFVYNTPSGLEDNAEILRAESLFFTTPMSQAFSNEVYNNLLNIQDQCAADFSKFCDTDTDNVMMSFVDTRNVLSKLLFSPFTYRRRLLDEAAEQKMTGRQLLEYMRSFYVPHKRGGAAAATTENSAPAAAAAAASTETVPLTKDNLQKLQNSLKPVVRSHVMRSNKKVDMEDFLPKGKGPRAHRTLRIEPNHDMDKKKELDHKHHDGDHHGSHPPPKDGPPPKDKPSDHDHGDHHDKNPPHGPPASKNESDSETEDESEDSDSTGTWWSDEGDPMQDNYFPGALGFGAAGDLCMYKNVDMLSPPCVQAVGDLYAVREAYWESYNASQRPHHGGGFLLVLFFGVLLGILLKKIMFWRRMKPFREFFHALNERPEIKADLEQKLGMEVPKMRCQGSLAKRSGNFCANLCFASLIIFGTLVVSLVISITSLEMTAAIANKMEEDSNEPVSPTAIILILLSLCVAQTALFVAGIKGMKYLYRRYVNPAAASATNVEPSAPPSDGGVSAAHSSFAVSPLTWYMTHISPRVNAVGQYFQRRSQPEGYVALSPNGEDDREMIPVGSTHGRANGPSYAIFTGIPVNANNIGSTMVAVPVTARPVSMV